MPESKRFPLAILRCDLGNPTTPPLPGLAAYRALFFPGRSKGVLGFWETVTYGFFDFDGTAISPRLRIRQADVVDEPKRRRGRIVGWKVKQRQVVGNLACDRAAAAGMDLDRFEGLIVVLRQAQTFRGQPIDPYGAGASTTSGGKPFCVVNVDTIHSLMAHELGHVVLGAGESWGLQGGWGFAPPPFNQTRLYGNPFCIMSAATFGGQPSTFAESSPPSAGWPVATFSANGPGPALATIRHTRAEALERNDCVRRFSSGAWQDGVGTVRLHAATDPTPNRTKLVVLDEPGDVAGDGAGTYYLEYRDDRGWDRGFAGDPAFNRITSPSVVIHQMKRTRECVPDAEDRRSLPVCTAGSGSRARRGRRYDYGLQAHFLARIPVPPPPLSPDWHATDSPYVRVDEVAPDGTWVDVFIGRPVGRGYRVLSPLDLPDDVETSRFQVASGDEIVRTVCFPNGRRFSFAIEQISRELTLAARVRGYGIGTGPSGTSPVLTWTVGGEAIPAPPVGMGKVSGTVTPTVTSQQFGSSPRPTVTSGWAANIHYDVWDDGRLVLRNAPVDGSYSIDVSVSAVGSSGAATTRRQQSRQIVVSGQEVVWEDDYYRAVDGCLDQLSDLAEEIGRESPPVRRLPGIGPRPGPDRIRLDRAASAYTRLKSRDADRAAELERLVALRYGVAIAPED